MYYDMEGNAIDLWTWAELMGSPKRYVKKTETKNFWVSTIWGGIDHSFMWGRNPSIYETALFMPSLEWQEYSPTRAMALRVHHEFVRDAFRLVAKRKRRKSLYRQRRR